ncbi:hypothetical protein [Paenibacillus thiaminolyticus]|uniref:hypothetical protein n=1 Tax=Paenibacillus thiaminolyticus TaxID=49283 RepID=UPI001F0FDCA9|nr:hypothetical protein [Paenibacillus thiaminolyticus]
MVRMSRNSISWPFVILLLVAAADISMLLTSPSPPLSLGVALDFMVVLPLLVFWLCMRRMSNQKLAAFARALATALAGYAAARLFVPIHGTELRLALDSAALGTGIGLAACALYYAARLRATYRQSRSGGASPVNSIRNAFTKTASSERLGRLLAHEASIGYHAFLSWRKKPYTTEHAAAFSATEQSSMLVIVIGAIHLLVLEGIGLHFLVHHWSALAAWILSLSNVYLIFVLIADYRLTKLNPVEVTERLIRIRIAHDIWTDIDRDQIAAVRLLKEPLSNDELRHTAAPLFGTPNIMLDLTAPVSVTGRFGISRSLEHIALCLDQPHEFIAALEAEADGSLS